MIVGTGARSWYRIGVTDPIARSTYTERSALAELESFAPPPGLSPAGVAAFLDDPIRPVIDVAVEIESNRLQRTTAVVLRRGDTLADVGALDATVMDLTQLTDGRRNPTARFAVADVSLADDSVAWGAPGGDDENPVAFGTILTTKTVRKNTSSDDLGDPDTWRSVAPGGAVTTPLGAAGYWTVEGQPVFIFTPGALAIGSRVGPTNVSPVGYRVPAGVTRDFTAVAYVACNGPVPNSVTVHLRVTFDEGTGNQVVLDGPPVVVPFVSGAPYNPMQRVAATLTYPAPGASRTLGTARLEIVLDATSSGGAMAFYPSYAQLYAGRDRGTYAGTQVAVPGSGLAVAELTWTDVRTVNRVELAGERRLGRVTSARVDVRENGAWITDAGLAYGGGRLGIVLARSYAATGVRVWIEETTAGRDGHPWLVEIDPMYVRDASADVEEAHVEFASEADPGRATTPFGNYRAADLNLTLSNTDRVYSPELNSAIDTGHRVEVAVGVRYSNRNPNPRADIDTTHTGTVGATAVRVWPAPDQLAAATAFLVTGTGGGSAYLHTCDTTERTDPIPAAAADTWRVSARLYVPPGSPAPWHVELVAVAAGASVVVASSGTILPGGYGALTVTGALPANTTGVYARAVAGAAGAPTGTGQAYVTALLVEQLAAGMPVTVEELVPLGVFFSDGWDAPSDSPTATISAADRLGRFGEQPVDEAVRSGIGARVLLRDLALRYLDLDEDQLNVDASFDGYLIPYAYPTGDLGPYLADVAKAVVATLYMDALDRLVITARENIPASAVAEIRADTTLIRSRHPIALDRKVAGVEVTARPLRAAATSDLWNAPDGGLLIDAGGTAEVFAPYDTAPAVNAAVSAIVATGAYTLLEASFYASSAYLRVRNDAGVPITVTTLTISGQALEEQPLVSRVIDPASRRRYGNRVVPVDAVLVQTLGQLDVIAAVLADGFVGLDANGVRKLRDVEVDALALLHVDVGERASIVEPTSGVGQDYMLTSRVIDYTRDAMTMTAIAREATDVRFGIADDSIADDVYVAGY